jgi:hypothetical protein
LENYWKTCWETGSLTLSLPGSLPGCKTASTTRGKPVSKLVGNLLETGSRARKLVENLLHNCFNNWHFRQLALSATGALTAWKPAENPTGNY